MKQQYHTSSHRRSEQRLCVISHRGACLILQLQKVILEGPGWTHHYEVCKYYQSTSKACAEVSQNLIVLKVQGRGPDCC